MPRLQIYEFTPGTAAEIKLVVKNTNVTTAKLVSKLHSDDLTAVSDKTITTSPTAHGQVVFVSPDSELTFLFTDLETDDYSLLAPYYIFDVEVIEAVTGKRYRLGESKICPQPTTF